MDLERNDGSQFLMNHSVHDFAWSGLTVTVKDRQTKKARDLINDITADVQQGAYLLFSSLRSRMTLTVGQVNWWP